MAALATTVIAHALSLTLSAPPAGAALFEARCGYCHSAERAIKFRYSRAKWRQVVRLMQRRAPLLIRRGEVDPIVRYLVTELKLVPEPSRLVAEAAVPGAGGASTPLPVPPPVLEKPPELSLEAEPDRDEDTLASAQLVDPLPSPEDREAERLGPVLLADRCSKCHTLHRALVRIDTRAAGEAIINRMRKKTGSGISPDDARLLIRFVSSRTGE